MSLQSDPAKMVDATLERPQGSLSERVSQCLRSRVIGVRAAGEVAHEIRAIRPELAAKFWAMMGRPTRNDEVEIVSIVAEVKALEPQRPEPARGAGGPPPVPADGGLSAAIEAAFKLPSPANA